LCWRRLDEVGEPRLAVTPVELCTQHTPTQRRSNPIATCDPDRECAACSHLDVAFG
jgi:hypothetical protein